MKWSTKGVKMLGIHTKHDKCAIIKTNFDHPPQLLNWKILYYLYFDRITYIISEDIQINKVLWSGSKILIV